MKVTIGMIYSHGFPVPTEFVTGWTRFLYCLFTGEANAIAPIPIPNSRILESYAFPTDVARNELCRMFLDHDDGDYLLFLDADMVMPPDIAHRLVAHEKPIVSARYDLRKWPFHTVAMQKTGDGPRDYESVSKLIEKGLIKPIDGVLPIDAAGAGALLIHRKVLSIMRLHLGSDNWFQYQIGADGLRSVSEDMWFFEQAKASGFQAWLDTSIYSGHISRFVVTPQHQAHAYAAIKQEMDARGLTAVSA